MKYPQTQRGNPHRLTINQHVFPAQSLRRFTNTLGELMVRLSHQPKIIKVRPTDPLFCAKRAWDQRAEGLVMKQVEDAFQVIAEQIQRGRASLDADQHDVVTYFYSLWRLRAEHRENPTPDTPARGVTPSKESLDQREFMESKHLSYIDPNGNIPGRVIGGLKIQMGMDRFALDNPGLQWGILRAQQGEFLLPDQFGAVGAVPVSPISALVASVADAVVPVSAVRTFNKTALGVVKRYVVARNFSACPT